MTQSESHKAEISSDQSLIQRWTRFDLACLFIVMLPVLSVPFMLRTATISWSENNNDLISWADDQLPIKQDFQAFVDHFGRPELVVVSWPDCRIDSPELALLAEDLSSAPHQNWFANIATTQSVIETLRQGPGSQNEADIRDQLKGILIGHDGEQACLVTELGPQGRAQRPLAIKKIKQAAVKNGILIEELKVGGIGAELAWLDSDSVEGPARLLPYMGLLSCVLCILFLRSFWVGCFVTTLGGIVGIFSAALIPWCGVQSNAIIATLPTLGGLLTISLSLHFIGYYRNAIQLRGNTPAALRQAYRWAFRPTLISATTTALGLGSLLLSRTITIQQFGAFGAAITICTAVITLTVLPSFLHLTRKFNFFNRVDRSQKYWSAWATIIQLRPTLIIFFIGGVALVFAFGITRLKTGINVDNLFVQRHEIIAHDHWLEEHIGSMTSLEVVVGFTIERKMENSSENDIDRRSSRTPDHNLTTTILAIQSLTEHLREKEEFESVISAAMGLPDLRKTRGMRGVAARVRLRRWLAEHQDQLEDSGLFVESGSEQLWRISVRLPVKSNHSISEFHEKLNQNIDTFLEEYQAENFDSKSQVRYFVTGLPLLFEQIEEQFIEDLLITYIGGLVLITIAVFFVLRNAIDALTAMIPNVLPAVTVLGGLSLLGVELDVGSVMTASIALGVAVDDTLHFALWYQRKRHEGCNSKEAVRSATVHCGSPILQTSVICGLGMALLAFAPFLPTVRFGTLIAMMLGVALVGDLLLLPAMLSVRGNRSSKSNPQAKTQISE